MPPYQRNTRIRLALLRAVCLLTVGACTYLFLTGKADYGFVLLFLLACGAVFPVTGLRLTSDVITVRQYYMYGLFFRSWHFPCSDNIELQPFDLELQDAGYLHTDEWWDLFPALWPSSRLQIKKFVIKHTDVIGNKTSVKTGLSATEQAIIHNMLNRRIAMLTTMNEE